MGSNNNTITNYNIEVGVNCQICGAFFNTTELLFNICDDCLFTIETELKEQKYWEQLEWMEKMVRIQETDK